MTKNPIDMVSACTCTRLRKISRRVTQIYDQFLVPTGLTIAQFGLMANLMASDAGVTIGVLADTLVIDPTTLTRNLRPLIARDYIKLVRDPADRRRQTIWLTERGKGAIREAAPYWTKAQIHAASLIGDDVHRLNSLVDRSLARLAPE